MALPSRGNGYPDVGRPRTIQIGPTTRIGQFSYFSSGPSVGRSSHVAERHVARVHERGLDATAMITGMLSGLQHGHTARQIVAP